MSHGFGGVVVPTQWVVFLTRCNNVALAVGGYASVSPGRDSGVFDFTDDEGDETENTVLDSTDCDGKVRPLLFP